MDAASGAGCEMLQEQSGGVCSQFLRVFVAELTGAELIFVGDVGRLEGGSPAHAARMTADALRGRSVGCPQSGTIQVADVTADGHIWPIRIRFTARADR